MKIHFTLLIFLVLTACSMTKEIRVEQLFGKYQWRPIYGVGSSIELIANGTFEYSWRTGLIGGTTYGTWINAGNKIILSSDLQPVQKEAKNYEIIKTFTTKTDSLNISIVDNNNEPVSFANCTLKADTNILTGTTTNLQGETKFHRSNADSLIISFVGYKTIRHLLDNSISRYEFKMEEANEFYEFFTYETWTFKKGRLYNPSIKKTEFVKKKYYEKIK